MPLHRVPAARWKALPLSLKDRLEEHTLTVVAAGVAFYAFLAFVPLLVVLVSLYGLFADPADIERQVNDLTAALPEEARALIIAQLESITGSSSGSLTTAAVVSTGIALWSASAGMMNLMKGVSVAYGTVDDRNFAAKRGIAIGLTLGAAVFMVVAVGTIAFLPEAIDDLGLPSAVRSLVTLLRLPAVALLLMCGLGVLFHLAEPVPPGRPDLLTWGTVIGAVLWLVASIGFSFFTANFGSYNETYGSLGAIVVMLLWLWLSVLCVLIGAEVEAEWNLRRK